MDFIFMLTRNDATVSNAVEIVESLRPLGLQHIGFKDIGVEHAELIEIAALIREIGAKVWMEVVSTSAADEMRSIEIARDLKVDAVMGGTLVDEGLKRLVGTAIEYLPFSGRPFGHPTKLGGQFEDVAAQCRDYMRKGCAGSDLLAYRATEADPLHLIKGAREGLGKGALVVAGSIDSAERIRAVAAAGADAFTIGTAAIEGTYAPGAGPLIAQLQAIVADCRAA